MKVLITLCLVISAAMGLPQGISEREVGVESRNFVMEALIRGLLELLRQSMKDGNGITPVMDPFREELVEVDLKELLTDVGVDAGDLEGYLHMHDIECLNLSEFVLERFTVSGILSLTVELDAHIEELKCWAGHYDLDVKVDGVTPRGSGAAFVQVNRGRVTGTATVRATSDGGIGIRMDSCDLILHVPHGSFLPNIEGLFGTGPESQMVNNILAYLVPDMVEAFQLDISEFLNELVMDLVNGI